MFFIVGCFKFDSFLFSFIFLLFELLFNWTEGLDRDIDLLSFGVVDN